MSNPYDSIIGEDEGKKEKKPPKVRPKKDYAKKPRNPNTTLIERGVFIVIIVILGILMIWNPFYSVEDIESEGITSVVGSAVATNEQKVNADESVVETVESEEGNESVEPATETDNIERETEQIVDDATNLPYKGNFDLVIEDVDYFKNDEGVPYRMDKIVFSMTNRWKDLNPRVVVYWYDDQSNSVIKQKVRAEQTLKEIRKGTKQVITIDKFDSTYFDPQLNKEIIKLELYDGDDNKLLETLKYTIG